jgi:hypothetical protein
MQFGAEHSSDLCGTNGHESAKIDGETQLGIEVPRGTDHRNILLHKIGTYLTVVMKALAKTVEPPHGQDGSRTHLDLHVDAELKEPQGHMTSTDTHHPGEFVLHTLWAGEPCPQAPTQHPVPPTSEHHSKLSHVVPFQYTSQSYSGLNPPKPEQEILQSSAPTEGLNHVADYHPHRTETVHSIPPFYKDPLNKMPGTGNMDGPTNGGVLPGINSIFGRSDGNLLPGNGNDAGLTDGGILPGIVNLVGSGYGGMPPGSANVFGPPVIGVPTGTLGSPNGEFSSVTGSAVGQSAGGTIPGIENIVGPSDGGLLPGNGNILQLDLSLPTTLRNTNGPTNGGVLPVFSNIFGLIDGNLLPRNGNNVGLTDEGRLPGIDNTVGSANSGVSPGIANVFGPGVAGVLSGITGQRDGGLLPGNGNILHLDLSLPTSLGNTDGPTNVGVLPGNSNNFGRNDDNLLPGNGNNAGLTDGGRLPGIGNTLGSANSGVSPGITDVVGPAVAGVLPGITGQRDGGLLPGNGNILHLDLSLPTSLVNNDGVLPGNSNIFGRNDDNLLPENGNNAGLTDGGRLPGIGNTVGSADSGLSPGIANVFGPAVAGVLPGITGQRDGGLLPGNGNILHLDLSLPTSLGNIDRPTNVAVLPGNSNIFGQNDHNLLPENGNNAGLTDGGILPGIGNIAGSANKGLPPGTGNVFRPAVAGVLSGITGQTDDGLLPGNGNILQLDLSLPTLFGNNDGPTNAGVLPGNSKIFGRNDDKLLPGNGNNAGLNGDGKLLGIGNSVGSANNEMPSRITNVAGPDVAEILPGNFESPDDKGLFGIGNIIAPTSGGVLHGILGSANDGVLSGTGNTAGHTIGGIVHGAGNIVGPSAGGLLPGITGPTDSGLLPGIGNILDLSLSLPSSEHIPALHKVTGYPPVALPIDQDTELPKSTNIIRPQNTGLLPGIGNIVGSITSGLMSGVRHSQSVPTSELSATSHNSVTSYSHSVPDIAYSNTPVIPDPIYTDGVPSTKPGNSDVLTGNGNIFYPPPGSGRIPSLSDSQILPTLTPSSSVTPANQGVEFPIEPHHYLPTHTEVDNSRTGQEPDSTLLFGKTDESYTNFHNHPFKIRPTTHTVHTVDSKKPIISSENVHLQSVSHLEFSKSPFSHIDSQKVSESSSDKLKAATAESVKAPKIHPFNGISHVEIVNSNALLDTRASPESLNEVPHIDHSFQHTILSTSKHRANEYKVYQPENDSPLKYLHYKHTSYEKDRSLELPDDPRDVTEADTGSEVGLGSRFKTRVQGHDEGHTQYERLKNARTLPLADIPSLVDLMKNSEHDSDITEKVYNKDITEPNTTLTTDQVEALIPEIVENKAVLGPDRKLREYLGPDNEKYYSENELLYKRPYEEYISEKDVDPQHLSSFKPEEINLKDSGAEELISFHELKIPVNYKNGVYFVPSHKKDKSFLSNDEVIAEHYSYYVPSNRQNSSPNSMDMDIPNPETMIRNESEAKRYDTGVADSGSEVVTDPEGNISYDSKLSSKEPLENMNNQTQSPDTHSNENYVPIESRVTYISDHSSVIPRTPSLSDDRSLVERYSEIPLSNILIPQHSTDVGASTFEEVTSPTYEYIKTLNPEITVSSLTQNWGHEPLPKWTPIPYVSEFLDEGTLKDALPISEEIVVSEPVSLPHSRPRVDENLFRFNGSLYFPHWETSSYGDKSQPTEIDESLTSSSYYEVSPHSAEHQSHRSYKSHRDLEPHTHDARPRPQLASHQHEFHTTPTHFALQPHKNELQSQPHELDQKHEPHLVPEDRQEEPHIHLSDQRNEFLTPQTQSSEHPDSLLYEPYGIDPKYEPHLKLEDRGVELRPHLSDHKHESHTALTHLSVQPDLILSRSHELYQKHDPHLAPENQGSDVHLSDKKRESHPASEYQKLEPRTELSDKKLELESISAEEEHFSYSRRHDTEPHEHLSDYHLEPLSTPQRETESHVYISHNIHEPYSPTSHQETESQSYSLHHDFEVHTHPSNNQFESLSTSAHQETQPHSYISDKNHGPYLTPTYHELESQSYSLYPNVEPHAYVLNPNLSSDLPAADQEIEPHSYSQSLEAELQSHASGDNHDSIQGNHEVNFHPNPLRYDVGPLQKSYNRELEPRSYLSDESHEPHLTTHDIQTHTLRSHTKPNIHSASYEHESISYHEKEPHLTPQDHESQPRSHISSHLEADSKPLYGKLQPDAYKHNSQFSTSHPEMGTTHHYLDPHAHPKKMHEVEPFLSSFTEFQPHIKSYDESYSIRPLVELERVKTLNEGIKPLSYQNKEFRKSSGTHETESHFVSPEPPLIHEVPSREEADSYLVHEVEPYIPQAVETYLPDQIMVQSYLSHGVDSNSQSQRLDKKYKSFSHQTFEPNSPQNEAESRLKLQKNDEELKPQVLATLQHRETESSPTSHDEKYTKSLSEINAVTPEYKTLNHKTVSLSDLETYTRVHVDSQTSSHHATSDQEIQPHKLSKLSVDSHTSHETVPHNESNHEAEPHQISQIDNDSQRQSHHQTVPIIKSDHGSHTHSLSDTVPHIQLNRETEFRKQSRVDVNSHTSPHHDIAPAIKSKHEQQPRKLSELEADSQTPSHHTILPPMSPHYRGEPIIQLNDELESHKPPEIEMDVKKPSYHNLALPILPHKPSEIKPQDDSTQTPMTSHSVELSAVKSLHELVTNNSSHFEVNPQTPSGDKRVPPVTSRLKNEPPVPSVDETEPRKQSEYDTSPRKPSRHNNEPHVIEQPTSLLHKGESYTVTHLQDDPKKSLYDKPVSSVTLQRLHEVSLPLHQKSEPHIPSQSEDDLQKQFHHTPEPSTIHHITKSHIPSYHVVEPHKPSLFEIDPQKPSYNAVPPTPLQHLKEVPIHSHHEVQPHKSLVVQSISPHEPPFEGKPHTPLELDKDTSSLHNIPFPIKSHDISEPVTPLHHTLKYPESSQLESGPNKPPNHDILHPTSSHHVHKSSVSPHHELEPEALSVPKPETQIHPHHDTINSHFVSKHSYSSHDGRQSESISRHEAEIQTPSHHNTLQPHFVNEPSFPVHHVVQLPVSASYVLQPDAESQRGAETHIPSHRNTIRPYFIREPSYQTPHEIQPDTVPQLDVEPQTQSTRSTIKSHYTTELQKPSDLDTESQAPLDRIIHPIYVMDPPVVSDYEAQLRTTEVDTQTNHNNMDPLTPYPVGDVSIPSHQASISPTLSHHELEPSRSDVLNVSTSIPIASAEKNALHDPSSGVFYPYHIGDESVRPRIICLTEQRDNTELLRSLKDDITKLKQKLNCD